jgi:mannose-6-phosphate isomerase
VGCAGCGPGAAIVYGLAKAVSQTEFRDAINNGSIEQILNKIPIKKGDHVCVPAGTLHSILEGAVLAEIQQNSNTTYRVYDWNRQQENGQTRELHVDKALQVIDFDSVGCKLSNSMLLEKNELWVQERLCQNKYFTTDRYTLQAGAKLSGECDGTTLEIWGIISGEVEIAGHPIKPVQFVLLPASMGTYQVEVMEHAMLLHTYVV